MGIELKQKVFWKITNLTIILLQIWLPLYRVKKVYTKLNCLIRKTGTNYTQVVHRMRLRPNEPQEIVEDFSPIDEKQCITDPSLGKHRGETELFNSQLHYVNDLQETLVPNTNTDEEATAPETEVTWTLSDNSVAPVLYVHGAHVHPAVEAAVPALLVEPLEQKDDPERLNFPEPEPKQMVPLDEQIEAPQWIQTDLVDEESQHYFLT